MARQLFTGNYGSGLGNYGMAGQLAAQRGQALGQAFQNVGQSVATAMKDYQAKKEQKEKKQQLAKFYEGQFAAHPEQAAKMGIDVNDPKSLAQGGMAAADNPHAMSVAMGLQQMQVQSQRMKREQEEAIRQKKLAPLLEQATRQQLETGKLALKQAEEEREISNLATQMVPKADGGFEIPAYLKNNPLGKKALQKRQEQELASQKVKSEIANQESLIQYRKLSAQANVLSQQAALLKEQSASTDVSKKIDGIQKQLDNIQDNPITVRLTNGDNVQRTFREIVEGKVEDIDSKSQSEAFTKWKTIHEGLIEKQLQLYEQIPIKFLRTNNETGETEVVEGTMADKLENDLHKIAAETKKKEQPKSQKQWREEKKEKAKIRRQKDASISTDFDIWHPLGS